MARKKRGGAGTGFALGDGFPAFERILLSESIPAEDDFNQFWSELIAARLEHFTFQRYPTGISSGDPRFPVSLLVHGMAHARTARKTPDQSNSAFTSAFTYISLGNLWLHARDELRRLAALIVDELATRRVTESKVFGANATDPKSKPTGTDQRRSGPRSKNDQLLDFEEKARKRNSNLTDKELLAAFQKKYPNHPIFQATDPQGALRAARSRKKKKGGM